MEVRLREGISDVGLELRLLTQRPLSPDAGRGADAERKERQGGAGTIHAIELQQQGFESEIEKD